MARHGKARFGEVACYGRIGRSKYCYGEAGHGMAGRGAARLGGVWFGCFFTYGV